MNPIKRQTIYAFLILLAVVFLVMACDSSSTKSDDYDEISYKSDWSTYTLFLSELLLKRGKALERKYGGDAAPPLSFVKDYRRLTSIKFVFDPPDKNDKGIVVYSIEGPAGSSYELLEKYHYHAVRESKRVAIQLIESGILRNVPAGTSVTLLEVIDGAQLIDGKFIYVDHVKVKLNGKIMYMPTWAVVKNY